MNGVVRLPMSHRERRRGRNLSVAFYAVSVLAAFMIGANLGANLSTSQMPLSLMKDLHLVEMMRLSKDFTTICHDTPAQVQSRTKFSHYSTIMSNQPNSTNVSNSSPVNIISLNDVPVLRPDNNTLSDTSIRERFRQMLPVHRSDNNTSNDTSIRELHEQSLPVHRSIKIISNNTSIHDLLQQPLPVQRRDIHETRSRQSLPLQLVSDRIVSNDTSIYEIRRESLPIQRHDSDIPNKNISIHEMLRQPPPATLPHFPKTNKTISACLFAMDDSIRLAEWIAYHYTVLPLGSLTIVIDPQSKSRQRVLDILDLWRDRIAIETFTNDSDWMPYEWDEGWGRHIRGADGNLMKWFLKKENHIYKSQSHKRRQNAFALRCMRKYKRQWDRHQSSWPDPNWLLMTDSDEFLVYNYIHAEEEDDTRYELVRGTTMEMIDEIRRQRIPLRQRLPSMQQRVTIADWLDIQGRNQQCWKFPGLFMSSHDSPVEDRNADVPDGIDASQLMTLRYRKAGVRYGNFSKTLLDVSWGHIVLYTKDEVKNIHNPHKRICGGNGHSGSNADYLSSLFRINHYSSGSLEAFVERSDDRRVSSDVDLFQRFQSRNVAPVTEDDDIRPWISWFVDKVGMTEARRLLVVPLRERYQELGNHPFVIANKGKLQIQLVPQTHGVSKTTQ